MHKAQGGEQTRVTAAEIARRLGVSQSTVSRVLSGAPSYQYSEETRRRIFAEADQIGYRPHAVARSLRERRTRVMGFCSRHGNLDARNMFLAEIIGSLQRACSDNGEFLLLQNFAPETPVDDVYGALLSGRIDGLILHAGADDPLVERLAGSRLPVVAIADRIPTLPSVLCDDRGGIARAVRHLVDRGYQRVAFVHPPDCLASVHDRIESFGQEPTAWKLDARLIEIDYEDAGPVVEIVRSLPAPPQAVCCWNDVTALILLDACARAGLSVPADLAVVGFDGLVDGRLAWHRLTSVAAHWPLVTQTALDTLRRLLRGEDVPRETIIPADIREGETT